MRIAVPTRDRPDSSATRFSELLGEDHLLLDVIAPLLSIHEDVSVSNKGKFDDEVRRLAKSGRDDAPPDDGSWCRRGDCPNVPPHDR